MAIFKKKKEEDFEKEEKIEKNEKIEDISSLKEQLEAEKKAREELKARLDASEKEKEAVRREKEEFAQKYTQESTEKVKFQGNSIDNLITAKKAEAERLLKDAQVAVEAGQFDKNTQLTADYADTRAEIRELERQKTQLPEAQTPKKEKTATDEWIEAHPEFNYNDDYRKVALKADSIARRNGIKPDSPEYFQFIEQAIDKDYYGTEEEEVEEKPRKIEAIPPSRNDPGKQSSKSVTLTASEVEIAMITYGSRPGVTAADAKKMYWEAKQEGIKNGDIHG